MQYQKVQKSDADWTYDHWTLFLLRLKFMRLQVATPWKHTDRSLYLEITALPINLVSFPDFLSHTEKESGETRILC